MMMIPKRLDHLVYVSPALDPAVEDMTARLGQTPSYGGKHGHGLSHNALMALGGDAYLEIFAPVDGAKRGDPWVEHCATLEKPLLYAFCINAGQSLETVAEICRSAGYSGDGPADWSRKKPDGDVLRWRLFEPDPNEFGICFPFFIDWQNTPHPSLSAPKGPELVDFQIQTPEHKGLSKIFDALGLSHFRIVEARTPRLVATFDTPNGPVTLS